MTFDADGKPIAPVEGEGVNATIAGRSQTTEDSSAGKVWMCTRCDPPIQLKSESDRAMHYRSAPLDQHAAIRLFQLTLSSCSLAGRRIRWRPRSPTRPARVRCCRILRASQSN